MYLPIFMLCEKLYIEKESFTKFVLTNVRRKTTLDTGTIQLNGDAEVIQRVLSTQFSGYLNVRSH